MQRWVAADMYILVTLVIVTESDAPSQRQSKK